MTANAADGRLVLAQISDLHVARGGNLNERFPSLDQLRHALEIVASFRPAPRVLLFTGDLADDGSASSYEAIRSAVDPVADELGAAVLYLMGNHDDRASLRTHLLDREPSSDPLDWVITIDGLRIIGLDTTRAGEEFGVLDDEQLAFLDAELAEPAGIGTLLAVHHPPIRSAIEQMDRIGLRSPQRLGEIVSGRDVRAIVCGHNHFLSAGSLGGVPVWCSPSVAYNVRVVDGSLFDRVRGAAISRIDVFGVDLTLSYVETSATRSIDE